jgi:hypothetical protein
MVRQASRLARHQGYARRRERFVITAGVAARLAWATTMLRVAFVEDLLIVPTTLGRAFQTEPSNIE